MAFTGELEHLHIVDIIQLVNTARKSGTFSVKGSKGESRIIFSNGYIVGASHLNNRVRIGTVLVKMNAITKENLEQALDAQKKAAENRKPLLATLIEMGKLRHEDATKGLKKLIEITLVELIGWKSGTFTLDTDAINVSPSCSYSISKMEQEISIDAQMLLMDAIRVFDEQERDRQAGKPVISPEDFFSEVISAEKTEESMVKVPVITADDLGLGDLDHLERKIPEVLSENEVFDPSEIHRQKIKDILADFKPVEQEVFVSFLKKSTESRGLKDTSQKQGGLTKGLILYSEDELIKHSIMTICKAENVLVFAADGEEELVHIIKQCFKIKVLPILVFDSPGKPDGIFSNDKIIQLRHTIKEQYPDISIVQMSSSPEYSFTLESFRDRARAVLPKPSLKEHKAVFIEDTINFLETFKVYIKNFFDEQKFIDSSNRRLNNLKNRILALRELNEPSDISMALLQYTSEMFERSITFNVSPTELTGDKAIGVFAEKREGPTSVTRMKIPLTGRSIFSDVIETGALFFGETNDEVLKSILFEGIGAPLEQIIILLPVRSQGKTVAITYGDFGFNEASPVETELLEIYASEAGLVLENALYRKQTGKASKK